jgi:hypothetical protein
MSSLAVVEVTSRSPSPWSRDHVRALVRKWRTQRIPDDQVTERLAESAADHPGLLHAVCAFVVGAIAADDARAAHLRRAATPKARATRKAEARRAAKDVVAKLLDMIMPNGKALRFCTGCEMEAFGEGFLRIAAAVPADAMVGEVLTEAETRALLSKLE